MIKITAADKAFSDCVRERAGWLCERCGSMPDKRGLHCSHFHGRGKWATRFDPLNCEALCYGCHAQMGANPHDHAHRRETALGPYLTAALRERSLQSALGRLAKRSVKDIAKHYRAELAQMQAKRADGDAGRIDFAGWL